MTVLDNPGAISFAQLCARQAALKLELRGLTRHGRSAYSICKSEYGLKGSKQSVFNQMQAMVDNVFATLEQQKKDGI